MPKITPFLWFDTQAEDAANFYVSVFPNSKILKTSLVPQGAPGTPGGVQTVSFVIDGQEVTALNGGTWQTLDEAFSFTVHCKDQAEVDHYWDTLSEGGKTNVCGWTKDKFGLSWQITPIRLMELISDPDKDKVGRVMGAMMQMTKIDIAKLEEAAAAA
jgi:predicted 3-demethylubiquinone-9 3-methyltransferase (glyoxalase superfamily)